MVRALGANPEMGTADLNHFREGQTVIGMCDPLGNSQAVTELASRGGLVVGTGDDPQNHAGAEHGCSEFDGHDCRLQGSLAGRELPAEDVPLC